MVRDQEDIAADGADYTDRRIKPDAPIRVIGAIRGYVFLVSF